MAPRKKAKIVEIVEEKKDVPLSVDQLKALKMAKENRLGVVCGCPGSGKSETIKTLADVITCLIAPTGTAACVMTRKTGLIAHTIAYVLSSAALIRRYYGSVVIIDEGSMVSIYMLYMLLLHLRPKALYIFGDKFQLDTVEGLSVFKSLLMVDFVPRVELLHNFRTLEGSYLALNIESLAKTGKRVLTGPKPGDNSFQTIVFKTDEDAKNWVVENYTSKAQIVAFRNADVSELNRRTFVKETAGQQRVICKRNYYKESRLLVTNGTRGIRTNDGKITYEGGFVDTLKGTGKFKTFYEPGRAITIHASQGQQFDDFEGIVYLSDKDRTMPLSLLYTAISRFPGRVTVVGKGTTLTHMFGLDHYKPFTKEEIDRRFGNKYDKYFVECMYAEHEKRHSVNGANIFNAPPL